MTRKLRRSRGQKEGRRRSTDKGGTSHTYTSACRPHAQQASALISRTVYLAFGAKPRDLPVPPPTLSLNTKRHGRQLHFTPPKPFLCDSAPASHPLSTIPDVQIFENRPKRAPGSSGAIAVRRPRASPTRKDFVVCVCWRTWQLDCSVGEDPGHCKPCLVQRGADGCTGWQFAGVVACWPLTASHLVKRDGN